MVNDFSLYKGQPGWPIAVIKAPHDDTPFHAHGFSELALVVRGRGFHRYGEDAREISRGNVLYIAPGQPHGYERGRGLTVFNLLYREEDIPGFPGDLAGMEGYQALCLADGVMRQQTAGTRGICLESAEIEELERILEDLERELTCPEPGWQTGSLALFYRFFLSLCRTVPGGNSHDLLIRGGEILVYLESNCSHDLNLECLAEHFAMSVSSFQRFFRDNFGRSPMAFLRELRLKKAARLIEEDRYSLSRIAQSCGFCDASHLGRHFRSYWGVTPGDYGRKYGNPGKY